MDSMESIAIIGFSGRFPGAKNVEQFWQNLRNGVESITVYSDKELEVQGVPPTVLNDPKYVKAEFCLEDVDMFDASFFGFSPREATMMDPQHRLFLETAWEALENAGYSTEDYSGLIGVFAGAGVNRYIFNVHLQYLQGNDFDELNKFIEMIGNDKDYLTTRVSYKLNLRGPSLTIQTACSTSLVAVHLACQSLLTYECDIALAGGVSINLPQRRGYLYQEGMILSPDGHCRAFDANARGTALGEGVGIVVLKRLSDALANGDSIHAVIKGSAINNDGALRVGYTAPSVDGQAEVIKAAQSMAQIDPETITYIEAHGTGTPLGDPIEIAALTQAFRVYTQKKRFCAIGSVKANIGHLDAAAGVAGLIKTMLVLKHKEIPPSLNFEKPNPEIDFDNSPFYINTQLTKWHSDLTPRKAGVSSFGIGGTNAHVILEEAPDIEPSSKSKPWQILLLSAKTATALDKMTINLSEYLEQNASRNLADVAYTLQVGRKIFNHRRMVLCQGNADAVSSLKTKNTESVKTFYQEPIHRDIVFMFSGQGSEYVNMGLELYETESKFREEIDTCSEILKRHLNFDLRDILYPNNQNTQEAKEKLKQTFITQPVLFVIEYALAKLWMSWGIHPKAMIGHSIGEYVAACLCGVFPLEDALSLIATRGRLMQELSRGSMLAIHLPEKEIQPLLNDKLSLAVVNGPLLCVVSGENEAVSNLEIQLSAQKVNYHQLQTSHASHSKMMDPILDVFMEEVKRIKLKPPQIPFISNVTGTWITSDEVINPGYWVRHLRQTVRFSDGIEELLKGQDSVLLELGPGHTLCTLVRQHQNKLKNHVVVSSIRHPKERKSDVAHILNSLGHLWLAGVQIDWNGFYAGERRYRTSLPTYPFERKRYWIDEEKPMYAAPPQANLEGEFSEADILVEVQSVQETEIRYDDGTPTNSMQKEVAHIWKELLGVEKISIHDNFFNLGGNSLIAASLFAQMERRFHKKLPLAILYKAPTIAQLSKLLQEEKSSALWTSLVEIQSGGTKPPFFCVHAAGGNVLNYRDLASYLGTDQPVFGFQAVGLDGKQPFLTRIEDMAAHYVNEIRTLHNKGPYMLGGYCMGGTIALEMAQQLQAEGQEVALLALFETYNWANIPALSLFKKLHYYLEKIEFHYQNFSVLPSKEKVVFFREKARELKRRSGIWYGMAKAKFADENLRNHGQYLLLARLWENNDRAAFNYVPKFYPGKITLFLPKKRYSIHDGPEITWERLAREVETYELPVYPAAMLVEPFVRMLAQKLIGCIDQSIRSTNADEIYLDTSGS